MLERCQSLIYAFSLYLNNGKSSVHLISHLIHSLPTEHNEGLGILVHFSEFPQSKEPD